MPRRQVRLRARCGRQLLHLCSFANEWRGTTIESATAKNLSFRGLRPSFGRLSANWLFRFAFLLPYFKTGETQSFGEKITLQQFAKWLNRRIPMAGSQNAIEARPEAAKTNELRRARTKTPIDSAFGRVLHIIRAKRSNETGRATGCPRTRGSARPGRSIWSSSTRAHKKSRRLLRAARTSNSEMARAGCARIRRLPRPQ